MATSEFARLPGFRDFPPEDFALRAHIQGTWRSVAGRYGFQEYDGPPLESLDLYVEKSGEEIVGQLYNFVDKGERAVAMRPEMTPSLALKAGASGAIAGVLGALGGQALRPRETRYKNWQVLGALAAVYGLLIGFGPGRDNTAHLGGFLAGLLLGRINPPLPEPTPRAVAPAPPRPPQ